MRDRLKRTFHHATTDPECVGFAATRMLDMLNSIQK